MQRNHSNLTRIITEQVKWGQYACFRNKEQNRKATIFIIFLHCSFLSHNFLMKMIHLSLNGIIISDQQTFHILVIKGMSEKNLC